VHHSEAMATDEVSAAEQQLYLQFFKHLGITDEQKTGFLASLLRNVFDASSKLDLHLAPYGATVHSAVSRMLVPDNPRDSPSYRWIRITDRVGFFSDDDAHAVRLVNIGLSYAYRYLEADAISVANTSLLEETQQSTRRLAAAAAAADRVPNGREENGASTNKTPAAGTTLPDGAEKALPPGGAVVSIGGVAVGHGDTAGQSPSELLSTVARGGASAAAGAVAMLPAGSPNEQLLPDGGAIVSGTSRASTGAAADLLRDSLGDPLAGLEDEEDGSDAEQGSPSHVIHEHQPHVVPSSTAVDAVAAVLRTVGQRTDVDGKDVLRKLLIDSLLCLVRTEEGSKVASGSAVDVGGSRKDWLAVNHHTRRWWPTWKAPDNHGSMAPPSGTVASVVNRGRAAKSSRWILLLSMEEIKKSVEELSVRSSRFFPKMELPDEEPVPRVHYRKPLRLTLVVASMLLLCTKEERFPSILARLSAAGRAAVPKSSNLSSAARHEFFSSGLGASAKLAPASGRTLSASPSDFPPPDESQRTGASSSGQLPDLQARMVQMQATLAAEGARESAISRQKRLEYLRSKTAVRLATAARPPPGPSGPPSSAAATPAPGAAATLALPLQAQAAEAQAAAPLSGSLQPLLGAVLVRGRAPAAGHVIVGEESCQPGQADEVGATQRGTKRVRMSGPQPSGAVSPAGSILGGGPLMTPPIRPNLVDAAATAPVPALVAVGGLSGEDPGCGVVCSQLVTAAVAPGAPAPSRHPPAPPRRAPPAAPPYLPGVHVLPAAAGAVPASSSAPGRDVAGEQPPVGVQRPPASARSPGATVAASSSQEQRRPSELEWNEGASPLFSEGDLAGLHRPSLVVSPTAVPTQPNPPPVLDSPLSGNDEDTPLSALYPRMSAFGRQRGLQDERVQADMMEARASLGQILGSLHPTQASDNHEK